MTNQQVLPLPYLCGILTIKERTESTGRCSRAELRKALEQAVGEKARNPAYAIMMAKRLEERGLIATTARGDLVYVNTNENNALLAESIQIIRHIGGLLGS